MLAELRRYVGFDEAAARRLRSLGPRMSPHFSSIVDSFYEAILSNPVTRDVLEDDSQVDRLKVSLHEWLAGMFEGPYDDTYYETRSRIGRVHVRVGVEQRFMLAAMNVLRLGLHGVLSDISEDGAGEWDDHAALDQICDIELAIMLETYREEYVHKKTVEAESLAVMGRLTAGLAHEVRNPLNAAKLQLDVLRRNAEAVDDDSTRRKIERRTNIVADELKRLSLLLDDFLNLARARSFSPERCDASELVSEVVELRGPEIESQGIELKTNRDLQRECELMAEPDRLKQVVNNLLTNAVEAVADVPKPRIRLEGRARRDGSWQLSIIDNGPGLSQDVAGRAFESFVTTKDDGTGLGLAIVKRIVELHGGHVALEPAPGGGTHAWFRIPSSV